MSNDEYCDDMRQGELPLSPGRGKFGNAHSYWVGPGKGIRKRRIPYRVEVLCDRVLRLLTHACRADRAVLIKNVYAHPYDEVGRIHIHPKPVLDEETKLWKYMAAYITTGPEIWEQTEGKVDAFVASQGTAGTVSGVGKYLKEKNPNVMIFAVEPAECPILSGGEWGSHQIEGIGDGFIPDVLDLEAIDGVIQTTSQESIEMAKRLSREEGIFCGISSGCNVAAVLKLARKYPKLKTIVTMVNDNGLRYFTTALCGEKMEVEIPDRDHPISEEDQERLRKKNLIVIPS